jgi:hypothetical protein
LPDVLDPVPDDFQAEKGDPSYFQQSEEPDLTSIYSASSSDRSCWAYKCPYQGLTGGVKYVKVEIPGPYDFERKGGRRLKVLPKLQAKVKRNLTRFYTAIIGDNIPNHKDLKFPIKKVLKADNRSQRGKEEFRPKNIERLQMELLKVEGSKRVCSRSVVIKQSVYGCRPVPLPHLGPQPEHKEPHQSNSAHALSDRQETRTESCLANTQGLPDTLNSNLNYQNRETAKRKTPSSPQKQRTMCNKDIEDDDDLVKYLCEQGSLNGPIIRRPGMLSVPSSRLLQRTEKTDIATQAANPPVKQRPQTAKMRLTKGHSSGRKQQQLD